MWIIFNFIYNTGVYCKHKAKFSIFFDLWLFINITHITVWSSSRPAPRLYHYYECPPALSSHQTHNEPWEKGCKVSHRSLCSSAAAHHQPSCTHFGQKVQTNFLSTARRGGSPSFVLVCPTSHTNMTLTGWALGGNVALIIMIMVMMCGWQVAPGRTAKMAMGPLLGVRNKARPDFPSI